MAYVESHAVYYRTDPGSGHRGTHAEMGFEPWYEFSLRMSVVYHVLDHGVGVNGHSEHTLSNPSLAVLPAPPQMLCPSRTDVGKEQYVQERKEPSNSKARRQGQTHLGFISSQFAPSEQVSHSFGVFVLSFAKQNYLSALVIKMELKRNVTL